MFIKTGDKVKVITGKDKGKEGTILKVFPRENRVIVEGVNKIKKHQKPNSANTEGGIVEKENKIDASNVMLIDPKTKEATRVSFKIEDGKKVRVSKKSNTVIK